jgi:PKD repeat protein
MRRRSLLPLLLFASLAARPLFAGANIVIVNSDPSGTGLNDPSPVTPVGGNAGTTLGQQRLIVFQAAAAFWGARLTSNVTIRVSASFAPLTCSATIGVLGSTYANDVYSDFSGAPIAGTWYVTALANKLAGTNNDLTNTNVDMTAQFNSSLGQPGCLTGTSFYLGLDNNHGTNVNFLTVALHEFAHGLGFVSVANQNGAFQGGIPAIFDRFIYDDTQGQTWDKLTSAQRAVSAVNTGNLTWSGTAANAFASTYLGKRQRLLVTAPPAAAGTYTIGNADFGPALSNPGVTGPIVAALYGSATDACSPITSNVSGKIALIDRGTCNFTVKVKNAQTAGAIGAIIADNTVEGLFGMAGTDATITIPSVLVSMADGATLRANPSATGNLGTDSTLLAGADAAGRMLLFAPNPYQSGASVSHFDTSAFPNLLMEPNISSDLPIGVDATLPLFNDIGWFSTSPSGPPTVNFTFSPSTPVTGQAVQFTDTSTGSPTSWSWNFGDGGTSTVQNPTHTFGTGAYQVSLTASNAGGSNTKTQTVVVSYGGGTVCTSDAYTLCLLGGRYKITSYWENQYAGGAISTLYKTSLTGATGAFWLSDSNTYEYLIRINTATDNGRAWIAIPTFTDVEFWITVEDLTNGQSKTYHSLPGNRTLIYDPYFFVYP